MKIKSIITIFAIIFIYSQSHAGAVITRFNAETGVDKVELKWYVSAESDVKGYKLYRSFDNINYTEVKFIEVDAAQSFEKTYKFIDDTVFKSNGRSYYYKLDIITTTDQAIPYDNILTVSPQISSTRHTWGSIKAMFR